MTMLEASYVREWDYAPTGPYEIQIVSWATARGDTIERQTLKPAIGVFVDKCIPILWGKLCTILDGSGRVVLQYSAKIEAAVPTWWGVAETFAELERIGATNPVDLAIWEVQARERYQ